MTVTTLYRPSIGESSSSTFGFFIIEDEWNERSLVDLKYQTGMLFLCGLQTTGKSIHDWEVIDGSIICQPDEVEQVMKLFEVISSTNFLGVNLHDIRGVLSDKKFARFIQVPILEVSESEREFKVANHIFDQISKGMHVDDMIIGIESGYGLEKFTSLTAAIDNKIDHENINVFYGANYVDEPHFFWVGAIYVPR